MKINDIVYGEWEIEDVLGELLLSSPVQRLKRIHQGGASYLVNPKWNITRYEHSVGVMLLVKKLGGSMEEQIAALLHDVSHTAFSHVIDFVLERKNEDYHEMIFQSIVEKSIIPDILTKHGYNSQEVFQWEKWQLLEQQLPALCADRIDYTLRDMLIYGYVTKEEVNNFLNSLTVANGEICIRSLSMAEWFTELYYKETIDFFLHPLNAYAYHGLVQALRRAVEKKFLTLGDFLMDDDTVWKKLNQCEDQEILELVKHLHPGVYVIEDDLQFDIIYKGGKARIIDPPVLLHNEKTASGSSLSEKIMKQNEIAKARFKRDTYIKIVKH